jgi:hypothetical protein
MASFGKPMSPGSAGNHYRVRKGDAIVSYPKGGDRAVAVGGAGMSPSVTRDGFLAVECQMASPYTDAHESIVTRA